MVYVNREHLGDRYWARSSDARFFLAGLHVQATVNP